MALGPPEPRLPCVVPPMIVAPPRVPSMDAPGNVVGLEIALHERECLRQPRRIAMPKLHNFLSHKLSSDTLAARQFISHLTTYSQDQIEVVSSAEFPRGEEWEPKIRAALDTADWLILLFTDAEENWDWCLYETGYFRARMDAASGKRLICLYKATISP